MLSRKQNKSVKASVIRGPKYPLLLLLLSLFALNSSFAQILKCDKAANSAEFLKGTWVGEFSQYACGLTATYPMTIEINKVDGKVFSGYFIWNDLPEAPASKAVLKGTLVGNLITLNETALVSGGDIVLGGVYDTKIIDCNTLSGIWRLKILQEACDDPQALEDGGRFVIKKLIPHLAEEQKPESDKRKVIVKDSLNSKRTYITLKIWDNGIEDGDIVTLRLNGKIALHKYEVKKKPHEIIIPLKKGQNIIELYAENVGKLPPNTAAIAIYSGGKQIRYLVLKSDLKNSEAIKIFKQ